MPNERVIVGRGRIVINDSPEAIARFERTRAALNADRGAGDSYYRCCNSPGFNPCDFAYAATLKDLELPPAEPKTPRQLYD